MTRTVALHHQAVGDGAPLLILHGLFGSGTNWRGVARGLADCRRTHLLDLRNHGESPHARDMDYDLMAADVAAFMDLTSIPRADVIGHSMGGKTAMRLALTAPARVARLMVVDIAPAPSGSDHLPLIDALAAMAVEGFERRAQADEALAATVPEPGLRAFLLQNLKSGPRGLRWRIDLRAIRDAMPALLDFPDTGERFDGETLFLRGALSDYVRDEHLPVIRARFPNARLHTLDGAGHWAHAEQPRTFLDAARDFLGCPPRCPGSGP